MVTQSDQRILHRAVTSRRDNCGRWDAGLADIHLTHRLSDRLQQAFAPVSPCRSCLSSAGCPSPGARFVHALRRGPAACLLRTEPASRWRSGEAGLAPDGRGEKCFVLPDSTGFCGWWNARLKTSGMVPLMAPYCVEHHPAQAGAQETPPWARSLSVCRVRVQRCLGSRSTPRPRLGSPWPRGCASPRHGFRTRWPRVFPCTTPTRRSNKR
jgi:hypothetical protein